jgi:hypothetical protein
MSFIFIVVLSARKRLTPKDVAAVKGLITENTYILTTHAISSKGWQIHLGYFSGTFIFISIFLNDLAMRNTATWYVPIELKVPSNIKKSCLKRYYDVGLWSSKGKMPP